MKKQKCSRCLGTGYVQDQVQTGAALKRLRTVSLAQAAKCMGITSSHLCYLEAGKRRWTPALIKQYQACCK